jgi:hypothetical protein
MKRSEELRKEACMAESDQACLGLHTKAMREERSERFKEDWLPKLLMQAVIVTEFGLPQLKYEIESRKPFGTVDFYPKANKVLIRKQNKWINPGLKWLIKNFELK